jgi:hypothetical protein
LYGCNYQYQSSIAMVIGLDEANFPLCLANMLSHPHPHHHPHSSQPHLQFMSDKAINTHHNKSAKVAVCMLHDHDGQGVFLPKDNPIEQVRVRLLKNKVWQESHIFVPTNVQPALICRLFIWMEGRLSKTSFEKCRLNLSQSPSQHPINISCTIHVEAAGATFHQHQMFIFYSLRWQSSWNFLQLSIRIFSFRAHHQYTS